MIKREKQIFRKRLRLFMGTAIIFFILGMGNILFGNWRAQIYSDSLSRALSRPALSDSIQKPDPSLNDREVANVQRLRARMEFYQTVVTGGKCFLGLGCLTLLAYLIMLRDTRSET